MSDILETGPKTRMERFNSKEVALQLLGSTEQPGLATGGTASVLKAIDKYISENENIEEKNLLGIMNSITNNRARFDIDYGGKVNIVQVKDYLAEKIRKRRGL